MKKLLLISMLIGAMPLAMMAQDDDLYFVPKKSKAKAEQVTDNNGLPSDTYYSGSNRSVDDYNHMGKSSYVVIDGDTTKTDIIEFSAVCGTYPDSVARPDSLDSEDYTLTRRMQRFDDYNITDNEAFWRGYIAGSSTWGWHSPWYYSRYGWYGGWYDPWYFGSWYGWSNPWYYGYYDYYYGWYNPWYFGYYGWGYPYYYGYYGWGYPYYYGGGGNSHYYGHTGNAGTIHRDGSSHGYYGAHRSVTNNNQRMSSLRDRAGYTGRYSSGNNERSGSGNFSGRRASGSYSGNSSRGNSSYNGSSSRGSSTYSGSSSHSGGSFGGGGASRSSSGGFSGGGSHGGGGGGGSRSGRR